MLNGTSLIVLNNRFVFTIAKQRCKLVLETRSYKIKCICLSNKRDKECNIIFNNMLF